jgi:hypothetical protein
VFNCAFLGKWMWWRVAVDSNLAAFGAGGVLFNLEEPLGWDCGSISGKGGRHSKLLLDTRWGMGLGLTFGMILSMDSTAVQTCCPHLLAAQTTCSPHLQLYTYLLPKLLAVQTTCSPHLQLSKLLAAQTSLILATIVSLFFHLLFCTVSIYFPFHV